MKRKTPAGEARASKEFDDFGKSTKIIEIAQPRRFIVIEREAFGLGYDVCIIPPLEGENLEAEFPDHKRARDWASGLRLTRGWTIRDLTEQEEST